MPRGSAARTRSSCRSATTRSSTRARIYDPPYDNENSFGRTYGEHREALELSDDDWLELREFSREEGITLFGTVFDEPSADFLARARPACVQDRIG